MPNFDTSAEIIADVLFRGGEKSDGTSDYATAVVDMLNRAYQGIWQGGAEFDPDISEVWWWLATYNTLIQNRTSGFSKTQGLSGF